MHNKEQIINKVKYFLKEQNTSKYIKEGDKLYIKFSYLVSNRYKSFIKVKEHLWKLNNEIIDKDIIYYLDYNNKNEYIIIPKWYMTDFGTINEWLIGFTGERDKYISYLIHDILYDKYLGYITIKNNKKISKTARKYSSFFIKVKDIKDLYVYKRKLADIILLNSIKEENNIFYKKNYFLREYLIYFGCRLFGSLYFKT